MTPLPPQVQIKAVGREGGRKQRQRPPERPACFPPTPGAPAAPAHERGIHSPLQNQASPKEWLCFAPRLAFCCEQVLWDLRGHLKATLSHKHPLYLLIEA